MTRILCGALLGKIEEQLDRATHLAGLLPEAGRQAPPDASAASTAAWNAQDLLGHLLDCAAGFCAVLYAAEPLRLAHLEQLRKLSVNQRVDSAEFRASLETFRVHIAAGFALLDDSALARSIPTVFVPSGEPLLTLLLGNLEHFINHKRQLFGQLKCMGVKVGTADLYHIR
jgi:hypothetical protein